jgi:hypothetical protein
LDVVWTFAIILFKKNLDTLYCKTTSKSFVFGKTEQFFALTGISAPAGATNKQWKDCNNNNRSVHLVKPEYLVKTFKVDCQYFSR